MNALVMQEMKTYYVNTLLIFTLQIRKICEIISGFSFKQFALATLTEITYYKETKRRFVSDYHRFKIKAIRIGATSSKYKRT